jgi:hypothetical protein
VEYAIRVPANKNLELAVEGILFRPRGRPVRKPLVSVQQLLPSGQLDDASPSRREGRTPCRRAVPPRRVHRDEHDAPESLRRPFLQQAWDAKQWIKEGKQAALDAAVLSPIPGQRGPPATERARVQPGESLAAVGVAHAGRHVVAHQPPAAPRQDRRTSGEARPVLLAPADRRAPDTPTVRGDASAHLGAAAADG